LQKLPSIKLRNSGAQAGSPVFMDNDDDMNITVDVDGDIQPGVAS